MATITISRQYGSGGRKIALQVSQMLGWSLFDKQLMMQVASDVDLSPEDVVDFTEYDYKVKSFWDRLFGPGSPATLGADIGGMYMPVDPVAFTSAQMDERHTVRLVSKTIERAYESGNVVILGRGGQAILRDKPDVLFVRVQAPLATRKIRLETYEDIAHDDTASIAKERDKAGAEYMKRFFDVRWDDPELYHLIINSGKLDIDASAELIVHVARQTLNI